MGAGARRQPDDEAGGWVDPQVGGNVSEAAISALFGRDCDR